MDERTVADGVDVESFDALVESLNVPDYEDAAVAEARLRRRLGPQSRLPAGPTGAARV